MGASRWSGGTVPAARALLADLTARMGPATASTEARADLTLFSETGTCALCGWRASAVAPLVMIGGALVHAECAAMDTATDTTAGGSPAWAS